MHELRYPFPQLVLDLFDRSMVNAASAWGVLEGIMPGVIAVDDPVAPTWAVGRMHWNTGFAAGAVDCQLAALATQRLARWGEFGIFRSEGDSDIPGASGRSERMEFVGRCRQPKRSEAAAGLRLVPIDRELLSRCEWGEGTASIWGDAAQFVERGLGVCLMRGDAILCEVYSFAIGAGNVELSVITRADHRRCGYAQFVCAHVADTCERRGLSPTYSCDVDNHASMAVARSLGFTIERRCRGMTYRSA